MQLKHTLKSMDYLKLIETYEALEIETNTQKIVSEQKNNHQRQQ